MTGKMVSPATNMPGSFHFEFDSPVRPTITKANASRSVFLPPRRPSASTLLARSVDSSGDSSSEHRDSRKRPKLNTGHAPFDTSPEQSYRGDWQDDISTSSITPSITSPSPLVSSRYRLAGGLDTPTASRTALNDAYDWRAEQDYRPSRHQRQHSRRPEGYLPQTPAALSRERNGGKRGAPSPSQGWVPAALDLAGRVINFCLTGVFKGFHAGGGMGYDMYESTPPTLVGASRTNVDQKEDVFSSNYRRPSRPGGFVDDAISTPRFNARNESTPLGQEDPGGGSSLKNNWVMVEKANRDTSPTRVHKAPAASTATRSPSAPRGSISARPILNPTRPSYAGSGNLDNYRSASYASPRKPATAVSRPGTSGSSHRRTTSSFASPRSPRKSEIRQSLSNPTSPEVQQYEKKMRRQEKVQDKSMQRLNQQLQDMIREGKQALGTRIDVEDDVGMEDEGYGEGTQILSSSKW